MQQTRGMQPWFTPYLHACCQVLQLAVSALNSPELALLVNVLVHLIWCQQFTATWVRALHWLIAATLAVFLEVFQLPLPRAAMRMAMEGTSHQSFNDVSLDSSIRPELGKKEPYRVVYTCPHEHVQMRVDWLVLGWLISHILGKYSLVPCTKFKDEF